MNKGTVMVKLFLYYILLTLTANLLGLTVTGGSNLTFADISHSPDLLTILSFIWGLVQLFLGFFTFSIEGLPAIASLIFVWLPAIYVLVYLLGLFRGND